MTNLQTPENVIAATAVDYGRLYNQFAQVLCNGESFQGVLHFSGGTALKNKFLRDAIQQAMGYEETICAQKDEVYGGMFRLAKRCVSQKEM